MEYREVAFPKRNFSHKLIATRDKASIGDRTIEPREIAPSPIVRTTPGRSGAVADIREMANLGNLPMLRHIPQPLDTGRLEAHIGIEAAGDGAMDDGLLLL